MEWLTEPFEAAFMQRALLEVVLLAVASGVVGAWVCLRGLAFFTHAVGGAAFPGLVVAGPLGVAPLAAALAAGVAFAAAVRRVARAGIGADAATGLLLVAALALGAVLASGLETAGGRVERLLFGTLVGLGPTELWTSAAVAGIALVTSLAARRVWTVTGFDPATAGPLGASAAAGDLVLLATVAIVVVASLPAVGALLVSSLLVVPAATVLLFARSIPALQGGAAALAAAEGVAGLWLAYQLDLPPGPAIATLAAGVFAIAALGQGLARARPSAKLALACAAGIAALGAVGCGKDTVDGRPVSLRVVATTTHAADFVREVGGRRVALTRLLSPSADPHDYEPRPRDIAAAQEADVVVRSGGAVDDWLADLPELRREEGGLVDLASAVVLRDRGGEPDPHWWHDPRNVVPAVRKVRDALIKADPDGAVPYRANAQRYLRRVRALDARLAACFRGLERSERVLVTQHHAFGYFAGRYGLEADPVVPSLSSDAAPSARAVGDVVARMRRDGVRSVFPERGSNARLERAIAREAQARLGAPLFADTLGGPGSGGETWLAAHASNGRAIASGLTRGRVPCRT
jgi:ABC-type Zn uptake system ZnuABC Zn-binding protein ZnuA/ABC-type Mn2+/Zn2+ transport system permease subunit